MSRTLSRPRFTVCTSSSLPSGLRRYHRFSDEIGAEGIEVDVSTWFGRRQFGVPSVIDNDARFPVSAIWITPFELVALLKRAEATEQARPLEDRRTAELLIVLGEGDDAANDQATVHLARRALTLLPWASGATLAVPATAPEGGRLHLIRLQVLRRLTEEWDLGVGFDLSRRSDALWEAEAAIQIAGPRLTALRVAASLVNRSARHVDVHRRALRAAADLGFRGTISLVPQTPWWLAWHEPSIRTDLAANRDVVATLFRERYVPSTTTNPLSLH